MAQARYCRTMTKPSFSQTVLESALRGGAWLAERVDADGTISAGGPGVGHAGIRTMYKAVAALTVTGQLTAAQRLADWLKCRAERTPGTFEHPASDAAAAQSNYTDSWILLGMQRLGRFDVAAPAAIDRIVAAQAPVGGFSRMPGNTAVSLLDACSTALAGMVLVGGGRMKEALKTGEFLIALLDSQPDVERYFYFSAHPQSGAPITESEPNQSILTRIDYRKARQCFFHLGAATVFLAELAGVTGETRFLEASRRCVESIARIRARGRRYMSTCKCAWGVACYYALTHDQGAYELARVLTESVFLARQNADGGWPHAVLAISDDYRTTFVLTSEEITAEFSFELAAIARALTG